MEKNKQLGRNIRGLREMYGDSQETLAFALGYSGKQAISNYENGTRTPSRDKLKMIAERYMTTLFELENKCLVNNLSFSPTDESIEEFLEALFQVVIECAETRSIANYIREAVQGKISDNDMMDLITRDLRGLLDTYDITWEKEKDKQLILYCFYTSFLIVMGMVNKIMSASDYAHTLWGELVQCSEANDILIEVEHTCKISLARIDSDENDAWKKLMTFLLGEYKDYSDELRYQDMNKRDLVEYYDAIMISLSIDDISGSNDANMFFGKNQIIQSAKNGNQYSKRLIDAINAQYV